MRITPSRDARLYSRRKASSAPPLPRALRTAWTSASERAADAARGRADKPRVIRELPDKCLFFGEITRIDGPSYGIGPLQRGKMCHG